MNRTAGKEVKNVSLTTDMKVLLYVDSALVLSCEDQSYKTNLQKQHTICSLQKRNLKLIQVDTHILMNIQAIISRCIIKESTIADIFRCRSNHQPGSTGPNPYQHLSVLCYVCARESMRVYALPIIHRCSNKRQIL